uniref:Uncharacterized protein n=1 Tax=Heliothis virescens TaxID=7102 RepID=A0A2A4JXP3_HELVI
MDKPKTKLVKSKSSNSAITTKSETRKHNKKSRSSGEFQPLILKKRGVYVEKKATNISINERDISPVDENLPLQYDSDVIATRNIVRSGTQDVKSDAPLLPKVSSSPNYSRPIPRPGRKRFLTSVLTILSKATTGTQYPDIDSYKFKRLERAKMRLKKKKDEEIIQEDPIASSNYSKRRSKYRSRIFNDDDSELEQLVVLQSTKEITHTPSNESGKSDNFKDPKEPEAVRWADIFPTLCKKKLDIPMLEDIKEVPAKIEQPVVKIVEKDPSTLVAEVPKKDDNKKFYNFFVDLLETTFNVYNVKTEFNPPAASSVNSSKVALEIDESVAKKLNIKNKEPVSEDVTRKPSFKHFYCIKPDGEDSWNDKQLLDHFQPKSVRRSRTTSPSKSTKRRRKLQSESFNTKTTKPLPLTQSVILPKKVILKKDRKKNFINLLKQQLKMDDDAFDEPQNFYQALKVIARNKRRCQKSIHIKEAKKPSEGDVHVCQFKRRRLLSASTKSSSKKSAYRPESDILRNSFTRSSDITSSTKKCTTITITETTENEIPSQHSLEVFGFDYEPVPKKLPDAFPSFPPSASTSMQDYNINQPSYMKDSDSGTTSVVSGRRQSAKLGPFLSGLIE